MFNNVESYQIFASLKPKKVFDEPISGPSKL